MELRCLPGETPTTSTGSGSPDPLYYCLPHGQRARERDDVAVTGPPLPGLAPAVPEVPTLGGGRGPGSWPAHGYCSWGGGGGGGGGGLGRQGCMGAGPGINRAGGERGGGERGGGRERVRDAEEEERGHRNQSPHPAQSEEHESALSVYDNLRDSAVTPDDDDDQEAEDLLEVAMETGLLLDPLQRQLCRRAEEGGGGGSGDSSSWSSCEILLAGGSSASNGPDQDQDQDADQETDPDLQDPEPHVFVHVRVPTPHHRQPLLLRVGLPQPGLPPVLLRAQGPTTTMAAPHHPPGGDLPPQPRVPPPLPRADPSASALRSLLTGLQGQIVRQRDEYETRIHSLEQHNEELQGEVVGLRANLAGQRRWYQAVQAKILESERARDAADLRNAALQAEMEQFFDTFGELNNEAKKAECIVRSF